MSALHAVLDHAYSREEVERLLAGGAAVDERHGPIGETPVHVATRRRREEILPVLAAAGADLDARTAGGMTAYRHALRRSFAECAESLARLGCDTRRTAGDALAVALNARDLEGARRLLQRTPELATPQSPEEARLLPDLAGWGNTGAVGLLLDSGWDVTARGLDGGTALHQTAWFGQPETAQLLVERGAPLDARCDVHDCTPLGWVAHGSAHSGDAATRIASYVSITEMLMAAGARLPAEDEKADRAAITAAAEQVRTILARFGFR